MAKRWPLRRRTIQRSFMRPGTFYSTFLGYDYEDTDEQRARYSAWDLVFHGANGINYYTLVSNTLNCPMIRPDGSLTSKAPWFFEEAKELKAGMGKLFMTATYENDGIAVHYSPPSIHAAEALGSHQHVGCDQAGIPDEPVIEDKLFGGTFAGRDGAVFIHIEEVGDHQIGPGLLHTCDTLLEVALVPGVVIIEEGQDIPPDHITLGETLRRFFPPCPPPPPHP